MDATLAFEAAVGTVAAHRDRGRSDSGLLALDVFVDLDGEPVGLEIAQVHPQEHLRPIRGVHSPGAGMDREDRRKFVVLPEEQGLALQVG